MKIEILPPYRLACMRQVGPYGAHNKVVMEKLKQWAKINNLFQTGIIFGIAQDDPNITPSEKCRYDVCIVIAEDYKLDDSVYESEFEGGEYLVVLLEHTIEQVQNFWTNTFPVILSSEYKLDHQKPILERYKSDMIQNGYCEICIPLKN